MPSFLFLPPLNPDLNPKNRLSKPKTHPRAAAARTFNGLWRATGNICNLFKKTGCWNYLKKAAYAPL